MQVTVTLTVEEEGCSTDSSVLINLPQFSSIGSISEAGINMYPNPVQDVLTVELENGSAMLSIQSLDGRLVIQKELNAAVNKIDLSQLEAASYLLIFETNGKAYRQSLIVH